MGFDTGSIQSKEVVLMGGSASAGGNVTQVAEANVWGDPHAADIVFAAPWKVVMADLGRRKER